MHKLSYSDSFAQNTHDTSVFFLSPASAEHVCFQLAGEKVWHPPLPLLLYTERQLNLLKKKFMDRNLTKKCRKYSCQENVLYILQTAQHSYEVSGI
jgi:hypothetical protein